MGRKNTPEVATITDENGIEYTVTKTSLWDWLRGEAPQNPSTEAATQEFVVPPPSVIEPTTQSAFVFDETDQGFKIDPKADVKRIKAEEKERKRQEKTLLKAERAKLKEAEKEARRQERERYGGLTPYQEVVRYNAALRAFADGAGIAVTETTHGAVSIRDQRGKTVFQSNIGEPGGLSTRTTLYSGVKKPDFHSLSPKAQSLYWGMQSGNKDRKKKKNSGQAPQLNSHMKINDAVGPTPPEFKDTNWDGVKHMLEVMAEVLHIKR